MSRLAPQEYEILHHAIGAPEHAAQCREPYRNYFCAESHPTNPDRLLCESLVAAGLMRRGRQMDDCGYFLVTDAGIAEVRLRLPALRAWAVETEAGASVVYATTRAKARANVVRGLMDVWGCTWLEALRQIRSVRGAA